MQSEAPEQASNAPPPPPQIFAASLGPNGAVVKGQNITQARAEALRKVHRDVVVCGPDIGANRRLAGLIERNANGSSKLHPPHPNAGSRALPHHQPDPRPPRGHTFDETPKRKAL